jgi:hypothetical protein
MFFLFLPINGERKNVFRVLKKVFFIKGFKVKYSVLIKQLHQQTQT